ncbi:MAG TPA: phosphotransferase [Streptosporangiaceae bacterium]
MQGQTSGAAGPPAGRPPSGQPPSGQPPSGQPLWAAEQEAGPDLATALIGRQFPQLRGAPVQLLSTGWDMTVFRVGDDWLFRFPRREMVLAGLQREITVLPALARRLPLAIPVPELIGAPTAEFGWPFWGARMIPGTELAEAGLPDGTRAAAAAGAGAFLRALHAIPASDPLCAGLPTDPMSRAHPAARLPRIREQIRQLADLGGWGPGPFADAVEALLDRAAPLGPPPGPLVLVHGDLHIRHLLVGPDGAATGVIDWIDVCQADPAVDLSLAYLAFRGADRAAFLAAYGPVDEERELRCRVLAVSLGVALAAWSAAEGHLQLHTEAQTALRRALS